MVRSAREHGPQFASSPPDEGGASKREHSSSCSEKGALANGVARSAQDSTVDHRPGSTTASSSRSARDALRRSRRAIRRPGAVASGTPWLGGTIGAGVAAFARNLFRDDRALQALFLGIVIAAALGCVMLVLRTARTMKRAARREQACEAEHPAARHRVGRHVRARIHRVKCAMRREPPPDDGIGRGNRQGTARVETKRGRDEAGTKLLSAAGGSAIRSNTRWHRSRRSRGMCRRSTRRCSRRFGHRSGSCRRPVSERGQARRRRGAK